MDFIQRVMHSAAFRLATRAVIALALVALSWFVSGKAFAAGTVAGNAGGTNRYYITDSYNQTATSQPAAIASFLVSAEAGNAAYDYSSSACQSGLSGATFINFNCTIRATLASNASVFTDYTNTLVARGYNVASSGCPTNATASGGVCTCNAGFEPNAGATACNAISGSSSCNTLVDAANALGIDGAFTAAASPGTTEVCHAGCYIRTYGATFYKNAAGVYQGQFYGPFSIAGATCPATSVAPTAGAAAPTPCPSGQVSGTVNGTTACYPGGVTQTTSSTTTAGAGGATTGSSTTTTTCEGSSCKSVTTNRDAAGVVTGSTSEEEPRERFCDENPDTTICQKQSATAVCSAATSSVTCEGDAIACAILKTSNEMKCAVLEATGATKTLGDDAIARGDTKASDHPGAVGNITTTVISSGSFDATDIVGGGGCPADVNLPSVVFGTQIVMPWSKVCQPANILGAALLAFSYLAAAFIAFKQG